MGKEEKEIWKLIELLNEFLEKNYPKKNLVKDIIDDDYFVNNRNNEDWFLCETIISKKFWFIKWLVENDKIDLEKLDKKAEHKPKYSFVDEEWRLWFKLFGVYESLLMLLSISNEPISDLISYLK